MTSETRNTCEHIQDLLDDYRKDDLPIETRQEVKQHLESCDICMAELRFREGLAVHLRQAVPAGAAPSGLSDEIRQAIANPQPALIRDDRKRLRSLSWIFAAAVVIIFAVAIFKTTPPNSDQIPVTIAQSSPRSAVLQSEEHEAAPAPARMEYRGKSAEVKEPAPAVYSEKNKQGFADTRMETQNKVQPDFSALPSSNPPPAMAPPPLPVQNRRALDKDAEAKLGFSASTMGKSQAPATPPALQWSFGEFTNDATNGTASSGDVYKTDSIPALAAEAANLRLSGVATTASLTTPTLAGTTQTTMQTSTTILPSRVK